MKKALSTFLALTLLLQLPYVAQASPGVCGDVFKVDPRTLVPSELLEHEILTEYQILKAAKDSVLDQKTIPAKVRQKMEDILEVFFINKKFKQELLIEIERRNYRAALEKMDIPIKKDIRYTYTTHKHYFRLVLSLVLNGAANALSYHYLGKGGVLVNLPITRFFKPEQIPDAVILELVNTGAGPKTKAYLQYRFQHGSDMALRNVIKYVNLAVLTYLIVFHHEALTDPEAYIADYIAKISSALNAQTYKNNLEMIKSLKEKKSVFESQGNTEKATKAQALIDSLLWQNDELIGKNSTAP